MDALVVLAFVLVALAEVALPLGLGYWAVKRFNVSWRVFGYGMLFFVIVQLLHIPFVLLTQPGLMAWVGQLQLGRVAETAVLAVFLGLLAGLFEEPGRFLVFRRFFPSRKITLSKESALLFGLGWGGIESIAVGVVMFLMMFAYMSAAPLTDQDLQDINAATGGVLTAEQLEAIETQNTALLNLTPLELLPSLFERAMTIALHVAFALMVFSAIAYGRKALLGLAVLWHAGLDFFAVFFAITYGILAAEAVIFVFAVAALFYIRRVFARAQAPRRNVFLGKRLK